MPELGQARGRAQFPRQRVLAACDLDALLHGRLGRAHRPGASKQGLAPEPIELGFKRRSPHLFHRLQPSGDRCKRRFGFANHQLYIALQRQQDKSAVPTTVAFYSLGNLGQPLLGFTGASERPPVHTKCVRMIHPQNPGCSTYEGRNPRDPDWLADEDGFELPVPGETVFSFDESD